MGITTSSHTACALAWPHPMMATVHYWFGLVSKRGSSVGPRYLSHANHFVPERIMRGSRLPHRRSGNPRLVSLRKWYAGHVQGRHYRPINPQTAGLSSVTIAYIASEISGSARSDTSGSSAVGAIIDYSETQGQMFARHVKRKFLFPLMRILRLVLQQD
jgi:hypothetical protein